MDFLLRLTLNGDLRDKRVLEGVGSGRWAYREEVCTFAVAVLDFTFDVLCEWRTPGTGVIASCGMLDFDDLCSAVYNGKYQLSRKSSYCSRR